jgi:hypothetical protein
MQSAKLYLKSSELGLPQPLTRRRVCPPPGSGGRGTHAGERGWESPNSDEGTYTVVLFIYTYFVIRTIVKRAHRILTYNTVLGTSESYVESFFLKRKCLECLVITGGAACIEVPF